MTNDVKLQGSAPVVASEKKKRKKIASLDRRKARAGWIFVLPFIIGFVLIYLPIVIQSVTISLCQIENTLGVTTYTFVGLGNYSDAFRLYAPEGAKTFGEILVDGLGSLAFDLPAILLFSLFMAVLLNQKMAGRALFRSIFFVPVIIFTGVMQEVQGQNTIMNNMMSGIDDGSAMGEDGANGPNQLVSTFDLQMLFSNLAIGQELVEYVVVLVNNIFNIVNRSGVQMLIFLAALQSISPAIYESCKIDGATGWETFWKITFPMISPMILVNAIYTVIDAFTMENNTVMNYIDKVYSAVSEKGGGPETSTAMSWVYFLIVALIIAAIAGVMSAFVFYSRKND